MAKRGRKLSLEVTQKRVSKALHNACALTVELSELLLLLETHVRQAGRKSKSKIRRKPLARKGLHGRGPNVRDLAFKILQGYEYMDIQTLAVRVIKYKGGRAGQNFAQNLGTALAKDKRFKKKERGIWMLS